VIDTFTVEIPTHDDLAEVAKKAFAYVRYCHPPMTLQTDDVMIAFRVDDHETGGNEGGRSLGKNAHRMRLAAAVGETR
jgi:hypothetical protein